MRVPDLLSRVSTAAAVPEQVVCYVSAVAGSQPRTIADCVAYGFDGELVLIGYPLHDPHDAQAIAAAVDGALATPGLRRLTVIAPLRPHQAPESATVAEDCYYALPVPPPPPGQKLRNLLARAGRELLLTGQDRLEEDHEALVQRYLQTRGLSPGTRQIFSRLSRYAGAASGIRIVSARHADGRLAAFAVGEFVSLTTAFFMFCFRDERSAPPGSADLVLSGLFDEAIRRGHTRMNLGLGVSAGIRFFKRKWGAEPFLRYVETSWELEPPGLLSKFLAARRFR